MVAGQTPPSAAHFVKARKTALLVLVALALTIAGTVIALHWPFREARVTQSLQEDFPATVTFQKFHSTFFPHPGCVGEGLAFRRLGSSPNTPPIVTIERFSVEARYTDLFLRPGYLARMVMNGFRVFVPPRGTPLAPAAWQEPESTTRVGEILADGASVEIARDGDKSPLLFDIHTLKLTAASQNKPLAYEYEVTLHNPLPPGEIRAHGHFGPWNYNDPGQTPVEGHYVFQNADLRVFAGIAGLLSSQDRFQGILGRMESEGSIDIPDFMVTRSQHPVHLAADFHAFIDGTNGDVQLERVTAVFLKTHVLANGRIAGQSGQHGKTATIDLSVQDGRMQDVLRLFVRAPRPPYNGISSFRAHVIIPPGDRPFVEKVRLIGDFGIEGGQFAKASRQKDVATLSDKARGRKPEEQLEDEDPARAISNVTGHVELRDATATFVNSSFTIPGASAQLHGTYNLESEAIDLHGTLKTDAELSRMSSGIKSVLLKPFDVFFKRKHAGAVVPVHLIGTYQDPQPGLDLPVKSSSDKSPSPAK
jgi:hypothetical protein